MAEIIDIKLNIKTGTVLIKTKDNKRWRALYKDGYGYYCRAEKYSNGLHLVDRFTSEEDINKIKSILEEV